MYFTVLVLWFLIKGLPISFRIFYGFYQKLIEIKGKEWSIMVWGQLFCMHWAKRIRKIFIICTMMKYWETFMGDDSCSYWRSFAVDTLRYILIRNEFMVFALFYRCKVIGYFQISTRAVRGSDYSPDIVWRKKKLFESLRNDRITEWQNDWRTGQIQYSPYFFKGGL